MRFGKASVIKRLGVLIDLLRRVAALVGDHARLTDTLRGRLPVRIFDMIVHTDNRSKADATRQWLARR